MLQPLLLPSFNCVTVLACNDLDSARADHVVRLHLERWVLDDECPDVITEAVCAKVSFECGFGFDLLHHGVRQ